MDPLRRVESDSSLTIRLLKNEIILIFENLIDRFDVVFVHFILELSISFLRQRLKLDFPIFLIPFLDEVAWLMSLDTLFFFNVVGPGFAVGSQQGNFQILVHFFSLVAPLLFSQGTFLIPHQLSLCFGTRVPIRPKIMKWVVRVWSSKERGWDLGGRI